MMKSKQGPQQKESQGGGFPVPFTLDAFREDILEVFVHYVRIIGWMTDKKTAWAVTGSSLEMRESFFDPDNRASDIGLTFNDIRKTPFALTLEQLYEYAFFGKLDTSAESMSDESIYTWLTGIVCDALNGFVAMEWDNYGAAIHASINRCAVVAEVANARHVLEGGESFFNYFGPQSKHEFSYDALTIRQMALLTGMEEMSIRAAANPKRATPLKTYSADGGTRIALEDAKAWLQHKGRYVEITRFYSAGEVDLTKQRFLNITDVLNALTSRFRMLGESKGFDVLQPRLEKLGIKVLKGFVLPYMNDEDINVADEALMRQLAEALELPPDILVLRIKELVTSQQLAAIERELREAVISTNKK